MTQNTGSRAVAAMMDAVISKEADYHASIKENHQRSSMAADRLNRDGILEQALLKLAKEDNPVISQDAVQAFMKEQRERLLAMAGQNVENSKNVQSFVAAAHKIKNQELSNTQVQPTGEEDFINSGPLFRGAMEQDRAQKASSQLPLQQEKYYREIAERLGEPIGKQGKKKNEEEDEDIMVVNDGAGQSFNLKYVKLVGSNAANAAKVFIMF
jgi:hypothetical protein